MADIRPFMSIRPEKGKAAKIAALPYDVYNRKEATEEVEKNPESFLKIDRAETGYPLSVDMYDACFSTVIDTFCRSSVTEISFSITAVS